MAAERRARRRLQRAVLEAETYDAWYAAAAALDRCDGHDAWQADDESPLFDAPLLRRHISELRSLIAGGDAPTLEATLTESIYRNLHEVTSPELYAQTHTGETKAVVAAWLDTCEDAIDALRTSPFPGLSDAMRAARFSRALENLGETALMLSGGGAWGLYHLGVVKALKDHGLLPRVLCGSSMGAIVAAGVGVRTDEELDVMLAHPDRIHRTAVRLLGPRGLLRARSLLSPAQLEEHVRTNIGDATFAEAYARTGRILNVTVSPTRARQKPRVLSHRTAAEVFIADATIASCSIPGLFPPVALEQRGPDGGRAAYVPTERWVDGSLRGDLPLRRMGRLFNVNHFVVSQANPFVLPFVTRHRSDPLTRAARFAGGLVRAQAAAVLDETRRRVHDDRVRTALDAAHALTAQHYGGDVDIHPRVGPTQYVRVMSNPSLAQLRGYILGGEQATWPKLAVIRDQTRIVRKLAAVIDALGGVA